MVSASFVVIGTTFGLFLTSIDNVINWITAGLYGGYTAANVVKWYWWRMNGYGYFWGMFAGIGFALILGLPFIPLSPLQAFPIFFLICIGAVVAGSLLTKPTDMATLQEFYLRTRPWGFWGPVHDWLRAEGREVTRNKDFGRDMTNVCVGIIWQTAIVALPIFIVIQDWAKGAIAGVVIAATSLFLKFNWYDNLSDYPPDYRPPSTDAPKTQAEPS